MIFNKSAGAEDYVVTATYGLGALQTFSCNSTSEGQCSLPPLECSQNITVTLKALDQQCSSAASNAVTAETGKVEIRSFSLWLLTLKYMVKEKIVRSF